MFRRNLKTSVINELMRNGTLIENFENLFNKQSISTTNYMNEP